MFVITPFLAAVLVGSFWTGVGTAAVVSHHGFAGSNDVVVSDDDHVLACKAQYRSYHEDTDMYYSTRSGWVKCRL
ncbi:MAG: hypothetical protein ABI697_03295 [Devosia sp.]